ncbi:hypothetical protein BS78_02G336200 [Paspalum vaginatum]|nr:hypothetical protein BS78_02G336200 [Paspalum vaginatum]
MSQHDSIAPSCATPVSQAQAATCEWKLWKHRNGVVFRGERPDVRRLLVICNEECRLWGCRLPRGNEKVIECWCNVFSEM